MATVVDNRRIVKNTLFLYVRMLVVMGIGLYTVRAFLDILGVVDYGLYNVIGGVVGMFSFLNGTLSTSSQRYFSIALANDDREQISRTFRLNLSIYIFLIAIIILLLETVGLWFVNNKMTIPAERLVVANIVYQISIATFVLQMLSISYTALLIAHERMRAFAYIGIIEAFCKLAFVFVLARVTFDRLVAYAVLMFMLHGGITLLYIVFCRRHFEESKYRFYWDKKGAMEMLGFSGWHLLGTLSVVVRGQGVNILINMFFNPAVNAARAIAFQIENAVMQLSNNFFVAVKPQMYKSYSSNDLSGMHGLIMRSTIICFFLVSLISIPFYFNAEYILSLWLKEVPGYAVAFTRLVLIGGLVDSVSGPAICSALATGRIRNFYLITGTLYILTLPVSYVFLRMGYAPTATMVVSIVISLASFFARAYLLVGLVGLHLGGYMVLAGKMLLATLAIAASTYFVVAIFPAGWVCLLIGTLVSTGLHLLLYFTFVCSKTDRAVAISIVKSRLHLR